MAGNPMQVEYRALMNLAWQAVAARPDKSSGRQLSIPVFVPSTPSRHDSRVGEHFSVLRFLHQAITLAQSHELAELTHRFAGVLDTITWSQNSNYTEDNVGRAFLDGYAYAAIAGPEDTDPIRCAAPRCGFMLLAPRVTYADHRHAASEVYLVMTPGAQWRLDRGEWFDVSPGDLIVHQSWQMHATRTSGQPFLAFAGFLEPGNRTEIEICQ